MSIDVRHISQCENYPKSSLMGIRENNIHTYIHIYIYIYIYIILIPKVGKRVSGLQEQVCEFHRCMDLRSCKD